MYGKEDGSCLQSVSHLDWHSTTAVFIVRQLWFLKRHLLFGISESSSDFMMSDDVVCASLRRGRDEFNPALWKQTDSKAPRDGRREEVITGQIPSWYWNSGSHHLPSPSQVLSFAPCLLPPLQLLVFQRIIDRHGGAALDRKNLEAVRGRWVVERMEMRGEKGKENLCVRFNLFTDSVLAECSWIHWCHVCMSNLREPWRSSPSSAYFTSLRLLPTELAGTSH